MDSKYFGEELILDRLQIGMRPSARAARPPRWSSASGARGCCFHAVSTEVLARARGCGDRSITAGGCRSCTIHATPAVYGRTRSARTAALAPTQLKVPRED